MKKNKKKKDGKTRQDFYIAKKGKRWGRTEFSGIKLAFVCAQGGWARNIVLSSLSLVPSTISLIPSAADFIQAQVCLRHVNQQGKRKAEL
jgi:hypothetical protein